MAKANYNFNCNVAGPLGSGLINPNRGHQTGETGREYYDLETERVICAVRLQEKCELDARFAEIIEMIRETRQSIEQTLTEELERPNGQGQSIQH